MIKLDFKGKCKSFVRTYGFLSSVLTTTISTGRSDHFFKLSDLKLPAPNEKRFVQGILDAIDTDSYRIEKHAMREILLADESAEIEPIPIGAAGRRPEPGWIDCRIYFRTSMVTLGIYPGKMLIVSKS